MKLAFIVVLAVALAQIVPSCDGGGEVVGWVEEKLVDRTGIPDEYIIVINTVRYEVEFPFWNSVQVGDLVKYDGTQWTIVRKRS